MSILTRIEAMVKKLPQKQQQWVWFLGLWVFGLISVIILTFPFKMLIKMAK